MIKNLIIVGAGGTSREIACAVEDINRVSQTWKLLGFLDDDQTKHGQTVNGHLVLGPLDSAPNFANCHFVVGIGTWTNLGLRKAVVDRLNLSLESFATIIHPSASVSNYARIGHGTVILQNVVITPDTVVGNHVIVSQGVTAAHDDVIEDFVSIATGAVICGFVHVGEAAYIGAAATLLPRVVVGSAAVVAAGALVSGAVPAGATVAGNPARLIKTGRAVTAI